MVGVRSRSGHFVLFVVLPFLFIEGSLPDVDGLEHIKKVNMDLEVQVKQLKAAYQERLNIYNQGMAAYVDLLEPLIKKERANSQFLPDSYRIQMNKYLDHVQASIEDARSQVDGISENLRKELAEREQELEQQKKKIRLVEETRGRGYSYSW